MKSSEKRRRSKRVYWTALGIYTVVLLVAVVIGLAMVWNYAAEYEAARPTNTMDEYVATLNSNLSADTGIADSIATMKHEAQSNEECASYITQQLAQGITYSRKSGSNDAQDTQDGQDGQDTQDGQNTPNIQDATVVYNLQCGSNNIGSVTLMEDESKAGDVKYGMLPWVVCREDFDLTLFKSSVTVTVPASYTVKLNGFTLGDGYITERDIPYDVLKDFYEISPNLPRKVTYTYDDAFGELDMEILNEDGETVTIDPNKDDSQFVTAVDEDKRGRLETFGREFTVAYLNFTSGKGDPNVGFNNVLNYVKKDSDLHNRLKESLDGYSYAHAYEFRLDALDINGVTDLGENYYVIDVTAQGTTLSTSHAGEKAETVNMRIIAVDSGNNILAVSVENY